MNSFVLLDGTRILVKESLNGTHYGDVCEGCPFFPCQDGLYGIKITHEGMIKYCWPRNDINLNILKKINENDIENAKSMMNTALKTFNSSYLRKKWKYNI